MSTLWSDIRYGLRQLGKTPGFTAVVIVILAVGIGANTAVFSVVNAVMLRPLPYKDADRLVFLFERTEWGNMPPAQTRFQFCLEHNDIFEQISGFRIKWLYTTGIKNAREIRAAAASPAFFSVLDVQPALGRWFRPEEDQPGNNRVVILSHTFWQNELGGVSDVIGKTITLDNNIHTVIGVMPPDFEVPIGFADRFWIPLVFEPPDPAIEPSGMPVFTVARLKKDVSLEQANAALAVMADQIEESDANAGTDYGLVLQRVRDCQLEGKRKVPLLLLGAAFVLLIACSNVANLFMARTTVRQRELAMRAALGASRGRLLRQMLTESLLLSVIGGACGLMLTFAAIRGLISLCPADIPRLEETSVDRAVLAFTLSISILTGLLFGAIPAWKAAGVRLTTMLQEGVTRATTGRRGQRLHGGLVVTQVGLSLVLLIGAGLLVRSLVALHRLDLGFRPQNVLAVTLCLPEMKYPEPQQCQDLFESLLTHVRTLPDVHAAGLSLGELGLGYAGFGGVGVSVPGQFSEEKDPALYSEVTPGFLETLDVTLLRGRTLTEQDAAGQTDNVVIDQRLARRHFGEADPVGQQIDFFDRHHLIVGVVKTVKDFDNLDQTWGAVYAPVSRDMWMQSTVLVVRTDGDPVRLVNAIRAQAAELEKDEIITRVETIEAKLSGMLAPRRFSMILLSLFAGIALILATVGVYGLLHYSATQRTREIAIRMALGAERTDVRRMVLRRGLKLTLLGVAIGIAGAVGLTRVLASLLFGVTPTDPLTLVFVSLVLIGVTVLASYLPARRAARIDPMEALRYE